MEYIHAVLFICPSVSAKKRPGCLFGMLPPGVFRVFVFTLSTLGVAYQHRYQQVVFENQAVKLLQPMERFNII